MLDDSNLLSAFHAGSSYGCADPCGTKGDSRVSRHKQGYAWKRFQVRSVKRAIEAQATRLPGTFIGLDGSYSCFTVA